MQKKSKNIVVVVVVAITIGVVGIISCVLPIKAFSDELLLNVMTELNAVTTSHTVVDVDVSEFFDQPNENLKSEQNSNDSLIQQMNVRSNTMVDITISLLYNNSYSEKILIEGEALSTEIIVLNKSDLVKEVMGVIAYYSNGKMIDTKVASFEAPANSEKTFIFDSVIPAENNVTKAKIFVFESLQLLKPYCAAIELTTTNTDYYGNNYLTAQSISTRNSANGCINYETDVDVFSFVPQKDGLYYFEAFSNIDTHAVLYDSENMNSPIISGDDEGLNSNFRISEKLRSGKTYYLYVYGRSIGDYTLNYGYAVGNIFGTVSPVKYLNDDMVFNDEIEATVNLKTYYTQEHIATLHLKDWSQSSTEYASFSLTGIHSGDYIVEIIRPGYITFLKKISLTDNAVDLGSIELIPGDVNSDGIIDSNDITIINELNGLGYGDDNYTIFADFNGDKVINSIDMLTAKANLNKNINSYSQNIVVPTIHLLVIDSQMSISGVAKANSTLNCNIYYGGTCLYEEVILCNSDGTYEFLIELNRIGQYEVEIYEENSVLASRQTLNYE